MMVEIVPASPDPDPEQQKERDVTAYQDYSEGAATVTKIGEALGKLQPLRERISQLMGPAGPHRTAATVGAFMETELGIIAALLTTLSLQHLDDAEIKQWLEDYLFPSLRSVDHLLRDLTSQTHICFTVLRRPSQCFHFDRRKSYSYYLPYLTSELYYINEHPSRYRHLLVASSDLGPRPKLAAEAGAVLPLVGIDRPAKKIFRWFTHERKMDMNMRVMSIVGPVGIGKTTLAVEVCNRLIRHETSSGGRHCFHCNVIAQASWRADRNILLLQEILFQVSDSAGPALSSDQSQCNTLELLLPLVSECLQHKRYFIIIDDLCEKSDWEEIKGAFPNNNLGSRILITTHVTSVAEACCSGSYDGLVHKMKPLNEIDSERLLLSKALGCEDGFLLDNMKLFCDETLRRCDGIPLFIFEMANWLKEQQLQQREDEDAEHERLAMYYKEQVPRLPERLEQALSSAFSNFLNDDLRLLLLYMSMFPYGYKFEKDRLILKWEDEGLLNREAASWEFGILHKDTRVMEGRAERLFSQLVDRNVITRVPSNCKHKQAEAEAFQWQINHFTQQFLASKSAEMGFIFTTATLNLVAAAAADHGSETSSMMPRRLALHHPDPLLPSLLETMDLSQTRSLSVSGTVSGIPLDKFVNLVLLDLEGWENLKDEDLLQICRSKMIFLKYLSVRNTRVTKLPREIKELRILSTLDVSYTQITKIPFEVSELLLLQHLDTRGTRISQMPKLSLTGLLVGGSEGTINSVGTAIRVPDYNTWHISRLRTLATVDLTVHPIRFLMSLDYPSNLRVLAVTWSFHQSTNRNYCEAFQLSIGKCERLESLTIHCGLGCSMEFLDSLESSPRWLKKFKVTAGRFASVPRWIDVLEYLAFVQITICNNHTTTDDLQILESLPKLQCLILGLDFIPGQPIAIGNEGFPELQRFSVDCPMPWITFSTGAMPKLTYLQLNFSSTPASEMCVPSGISNVRRLTEVALSYNAQYLNSPSIKMTVEAVTKQVAEHSNPIDLFINSIELYDVQEVDDELTEITTGTSSRTNAGAEDDVQAVVDKATAAIQCEITEVDS